MNKDGAIKAIDAAFANGVDRLFSVFVEGLEEGETPTDLAGRFRKGLAFHCDAHGKTTALVENYFNGFKS